MDTIEKGTNFSFSKILSNGKTDRFIKLDLMDLNGVIINTYTLTHTINGLYIKSDLVANTAGIFLVKYTVFKDVGLTKIDTRYKIVADKIRVDDTIERITNTVDFGDGQSF